ncbi:MAG: NAD(P)-dependent oxidoreductase [Microcella sp.]|uniref:NAD(P)-dependent oxidoreductase n=1 Tax=Microcella sp. TaxID=1913979 RepID=UPI0024C75E99|nr:NAD(P)-binding domain-containing protein [Microcella sp.]UYN84457.1 MAG: NAD(P)-dependent oxidoreductase [Microcella sp.]
MTDTHSLAGSTPRTIAVLGLGPMGAAIAAAADTRGYRVVAWNRRPKTLGDIGFEHDTAVTLASTPRDAASDADLVVVCVRNHDASRLLLDQIAPESRGRIVVNVSTGTPGEAADSASHAAQLGVRYVTGAIMVPTPMVGTDDCFVIYAGASEDLAEASYFFDVMNGTSDVVGDDHAVPPALDLAMLDIYFSGMYAHLHATALARAHGIEASRFLPYAQGIADTLRGSLPDLTTAMERRRYDAGEASLEMCLSFLEHIVESSRDAGIDPGIAELVRTASARAMQRWPGNTDWDVVAEHFLAPPHATSERAPQDPETAKTPV